jgi:hypothetical protein
MWGARGAITRPGRSNESGRGTASQALADELGGLVTMVLVDHRLDGATSTGSIGRAAPDEQIARDRPDPCRVNASLKLPENQRFEIVGTAPRIFGNWPSLK